MATPKAKTLQERFGFLDPDIRKPEHDEMIKWIEKNIEDILLLVLKLKSRPTRVITTWEPVVLREPERGQLLGYIDLIATVPDGEARYELERLHGVSQIVFEAKTELETLGVLFRQLRMYREGYIRSERVRKMPFVVVCPDDSEAEIIREQGFNFLKYDPTMTFAMGGV